MESTLKSQSYALFEISLKDIFRDGENLSMEQNLLEMLSLDLCQVVKQPPKEFWLSQAHIEANPSLPDSSLQVRHCLVFLAEKIPNLWTITPSERKILTFQFQLLQEELDVENCSLEAAFRSRFGGFRRWEKGEAVIRKDAVKVEVSQNQVRPREESLSEETSPSRKKIVQTKTKSSAQLEKQEQLLIENPEEKTPAEIVRDYFQKHFPPQPYVQDVTKTEEHQIRKRHHENPEDSEEEEEKAVTPSKGVASTQKLQENQDSATPLHKKNKKSLTSQKQKKQSTKFNSQRKKSTGKPTSPQTPQAEP